MEGRNINKMLQQKPVMKFPHTKISGSSDLAQFIKEEEQVFEFETTFDVSFKKLVTNNISSTV